VTIIPAQEIEQGIRGARMMFPRVYFDKSKAAGLLNALKRYRRQVNQTTNEPGAPLHDAASHGADAFRYLAAAVEQLTNETWGGRLAYRKTLTS
jgi:phage terminase large subunit